MRYRIQHITTYTYDRPVTLSPHLVRLHPRCDITQVVRSFSLGVNPLPAQVSETIDLDGNNILRLLFSPDPLESLTIEVESEVETFRTNPFGFLLEPWATRLPIDYPVLLQNQLQPYLFTSMTGMAGLDPIATQIALELWQRAEANPVTFLWELNQEIHGTCQHMIRETGEPFPPSITWAKRAGSCRDLTVLFIEVCRAAGLATRFVSGYLEPDPGNMPELHAWAEVYLPGAGWRGYDPTQNLAVADRHVPLVASTSYRSAAPVSGSLKTGMGAASQIHSTLSMQRLDPPAQ